VCVCVYVCACACVYEWEMLCHHCQLSNLEKPTLISALAPPHNYSCEIKREVHWSETVIRCDVRSKLNALQSSCVHITISSPILLTPLIAHSCVAITHHWLPSDWDLLVLAVCLNHVVIGFNPAGWDNWQVFILVALACLPHGLEGAVHSLDSFSWGTRK